MGKQLNLPLLAALTLLFSWLCSAADIELTEKHYRQAAWQFYLQQPAAALEALQLAPSHDARTQLLEAGLYLQLAMPLHAATLLETILAQPADNKDSLPQDLRNVALLQFARFQLEAGNKASAKHYLSQVNISADKQYLGQQQLLSQLINWPQISLPTQPEFTALADQAEMPYIISNQALIIAKQQPEIAQQWLAQLQARLDQTAKTNFWQSLFSGHWFVLNSPEGFSYPKAERQGLVDYVQLTRADLYIKQQNWAAADEILSQFAQQSVLSSSALTLYQKILTEQRHIPTLLAVLQQQIKQQPFSENAWQAATLIGTQLERNSQFESALAAYRWADEYYQQQQTSLLKEANPLNVNQLAKPLSAWQQIQFSNDEQLYRLHQQSMMLQQLINQAPERQQRLLRLQQVADYKLAKQQSLLETQLSKLEQQRQLLIEKINSVQEQITHELSKSNSLFLSEGLLQQQLAMLSQAKQRSTWLQQQKSEQYQEQAMRVQRLEGVLQWQYLYHQSAREWALTQKQQALSKLLEQVTAKLEKLAQWSKGETRLVQQQQRIKQLNINQQNLNMALFSEQQHTVAQVNQRLQQHRITQVERLLQLQRHNKQAMARMMELLLTAASPISPLSRHEATDAN
ncbi:hypothetical protein [Rheinheimera sp. WS51]|uniref:hypothetical protein n=1 Tax=Rheinheimera sp. WS51 TaxID=3425886 RepID=UPI003D92174D